MAVQKQTSQRQKGRSSKGRSMIRRVLRWVICLTVAMLIIPIVQVVILKWVDPDVTPLMLRRKVEARKEGGHLDIHREWIDFAEVAPDMYRAVISSEDNLFLQHHGFSERGIKQALRERRENGTVKHGGSTISQQTAKNVFTFGTRTYIRKAVETYYTVLIELIWGKRRIMEVYLNVIETGDGIFGVEAASVQYFHHSSRRMSRSETALLAACLPNPRKYSVTHPGPYMSRRQKQLIDLMPKMGRLDFGE